MSRFNGKQFALSSHMVPASLRTPNAVFWITVGNDGRTRTFINEHDVNAATISDG